MKKNILMMLACASVVFFSCQKGPAPEDQKAKEDQEKTEKAEQFWDVVGQLVAASDITPDYKGKTFEPVMGVADASDPQTRIVATNSAAAAARCYADLIGEDSINENTTSYTWSNPEVGTLIYTKTSGTAWAEVKVKIPSVPHLSKIIYRSAEQGDTNASFDGSAYYRFGDVINLGGDMLEDLWVCVRPAFSMEGKGETHWMSIGNLPEENLWHYTSSHNMEYYFPTELKYSKEHMQNLAEMLYAICFPDQWQANVFNYSKVGWTGPYGLPIFHDFSRNNISYHNAKFWTNVAAEWRERSIAEALFGCSLDEISGMIERDGLHFLYKGYSWVTAWTNYATVYQGRFISGIGEHSNMHTEKPYTDIKVQMVYPKQEGKDVAFDVRYQQGVVNTPFFGDSNPRYVVRYATGAELSDTGKYSDVHGPIPGAEDVYRYYRDVVPVNDLTVHAPEITDFKIVNNRMLQDMSDFNGNAHYKIGNVYKDELDNLWFVVNMAGTGGRSRDVCEPSPYSELVSFSGMARIPGTRYINGLPTYEQSVRTILSLHSLIYNSLGELYDTDKEMEDVNPSSAVIRFVTMNARVDISNMFQFVQSNDPQWERSYSHMTGFAYSDPAANALGQPVSRYLYVIDLDNSHPPHFFWKHYPENPSEMARTYDDFSNELIFLQDVADQRKVSWYGRDLYATKGLHPSQGTGDDRPFRTQADPNAENLELYMYDFNKWQSFSFPTDMWNEPVLMFRSDAVYDRGNEYATVTVNGHELTLVKEFPLSYDTPADLYDEDARKKSEQQNLAAFYSYKGTMWVDRPYYHLDEGRYEYPDWMRAWGRR